MNRLKTNGMKVSDIRDLRVFLSQPLLCFGTMDASAFSAIVTYHSHFLVLRSTLRKKTHFLRSDLEVSLDISLIFACLGPNSRCDVFCY